MNERRLVIFLSGVAAIASLAAGLGARWWQGLIPVALLAGCLLIKPLRKLDWLPSAVLVLYLIAGSVAMLTGGSAVWLVYGACAALLSWDMANFSRSLAGADNDGLVQRCKRIHYKMLGLTSGLGLAAVTVGLIVRLRLPFIVMLIALVGASAGLLLAWWRLQKRTHENNAG